MQYGRIPARPECTQRPLLWRIRLWIAGILFLTAGRLVPEIYDVWLDDAPRRHPESQR